MPELPEVETIARALREGGRGGVPIPGRRIERAELLWPCCLATPTAEFQHLLPGQTVEAVERRGKFLILRLNTHALLIHLRMSGDVRVEAAGQPLLKHDRAAFHFADGLHLAFNDARKFGRLWFTPLPQNITAHLGPEPFDEALTPSAFHQRLSTRQRQLKPLLLDQSFLAGMGNIYTDEALHRAGLHPLCRSDALQPQHSARLLDSIRAVLSDGIQRNGASIDWVYRGGDFQNNFRAYQRTGQPCPVCATPIQRLVVGQRGTHICPRCQPLEPH